MGATHKIIMSPLLYKKVMQWTTLGSTATNATLCKNIYELIQYGITCGRDVYNIISYIDINYSQCKACREVMANAIKHILEAINNGVENNDIKNYFKKKKNDYWDEMEKMKTFQG